MILIIGRKPRTGKRSGHAASAGLLLLALVTGCATAKSTDGERPLVVATTSIIGDIAENVVGDEGTVEVLIPIGVDAHEFEASARQATLLATADLVVANGLGLEHGIADLLASVAADGTPVIELAPLIGPLPLADGNDDPHFWMDPIRAGEAAIAFAGELESVDSDGSWSDRAGSYAVEMADTDEIIAGKLEAIPSADRKLVTNHESFGYFADRYGFDVVGVVIPGGSPQAEPGSADIAALVAVMKEEGVAVIFAETTQPSTLATAIAAELGAEAEVVELFTESLGEEGSGAETLSTMLLSNASAIASALGGDG